MNETTQPQVGENSTEEIAQPQAENEVTPQTDEQTELKVKYKYNHEEIEEVYDSDTYQKGKNYDKIQERNTEYETAAKELEAGNDYISMVAKENGISKKEAGERLRQHHLQKQDEAKAAQDNLTVEQVKKDRDQQVRETTLNKREAEEQAETAEKKQADELQEYFNKQINDFAENHKEIDVNNLPQSMLDDINAGIPPEKALHTYELERKIAEMEEKQQIDKVNTDNANASTGALGSADTPQGALTQKMIDNMSPAEKEKNHRRIWKFVTGN